MLKLQPFHNVNANQVMTKADAPPSVLYVVLGFIGKLTTQLFGFDDLLYCIFQIKRPNTYC